MLEFGKRLSVLPFLTASEREVEVVLPENRELAIAVLKAREAQQRGETLTYVSRLFIPLYVARSQAGFQVVVNSRGYEQTTFRRPDASSLDYFLLKLKALGGVEDLGEFLSKHRLPSITQSERVVRGLVSGQARSELIQHSRLLVVREVDSDTILEGALGGDAALSAADTLEEIEARCNHELDMANQLETLLMEMAEKYVYHMDQVSVDTEHQYSSKLNDLFREVEEAVFRLRREAREEIDDHQHTLEMRIRLINSRIRSLEKEKSNLTSRLREEEVRYSDLRKKLITSDAYHTLEKHSTRVHYDIEKAAERDARRLKEIEGEKKGLEQERSTLLEGRDSKTREITVRYETLISGEEQRIPSYENERDQTLTQLKQQKKMTLDLLEEMMAQLTKAREDLRSFTHGELEQFKTENLPLTLRENTILLPAYVFEYRRNGKPRREVLFPEAIRKGGFLSRLTKRSSLSSVQPRCTTYEKNMRSTLQEEIQKAATAETRLNDILKNGNLIADPVLSNAALAGLEELEKSGAISKELSGKVASLFPAGQTRRPGSRSL